jgi:glycosyltransferase involved in cell wall biosynthesis
MTKSKDLGEKKTVVSAGHKNFHLLFTAAEMAKRGRLSILIAGAIPTPFEIKLLSRGPFSSKSKIQRFLNRKEEVPAALIRQSRVSEILSSISRMMCRFTVSAAIDGWVQGIAMRIYGRRAGRILRNAGLQDNTVYHFRAGFGQSSLQVAKSLGLKTICDHSIVHPLLLEPLIEQQGRFPEGALAPVKGFWRNVLADINEADEVLVNSDFVAKTFEAVGFDRSRIKIAYQGVEDKFMARLPRERIYRGVESSAPLRLLFAGGITQRKGINILQEVLVKFPNLPVTLDIAGSLPSHNVAQYALLMNDPRVRFHGMLGQNALAELMSSTDVFVFPTFAEGSARVLFEAMAAGCAVITTENAGSVLIDGHGGFLIAPGSVEALSDALKAAVSNGDRIGQMGIHNHALIRNNYTQKHYGDQIEKVYG